MKNKDFINNNSNLETQPADQNNLIKAMETAKKQYFIKITKTLCDLNISLKSLLVYLENLRRIKVYCLLLLFHGKKFITSFREKD